MKVVENLFKKAYGKFQCVPTTYPTENKEENYLEFYIFQVSCPFLDLHDSNISKFEFMNNLFANLLVAWLYMFLHSSVQKQRIPINGDCSNLTVAT